MRHILANNALPITNESPKLQAPPQIATLKKSKPTTKKPSPAILLPSHKRGNFKNVEQNPPKPQDLDRKRNSAKIRPKKPRFPAEFAIPSPQNPQKTSKSAC
ncbi:MAG: hypothetical protein IT426_01060 [Pirellulales bacterium]|nr:hypothetical protein [Pirellulales bacterium]